jgi:glycosyltransferase involved in cell wall biosynthesis
MEEKRAAREALGLPVDAFVVGYAGQMDRRKDPASGVRLAESLEHLLGRELHVLLSGREDRHAAESLDAALASSPLGKRIHRTGPLQDLSLAFKALDLYVMTSRNEGYFPIALLEALERAVPVVAPSVGGIATELVDGEGGFLIQKPDDRKPLSAEHIAAVAERLAPIIADASQWEIQKQKAQALAARISRNYDAATLFREAVAPWL